MDPMTQQELLEAQEAMMSKTRPEDLCDTCDAPLPASCGRPECPMSFDEERNDPESTAVDSVPGEIFDPENFGFNNLHPLWQKSLEDRGYAVYNISSELIRYYMDQNGNPIAIENPIALVIAPSGSHRVVHVDQHYVTGYEKIIDAVTVIHINPETGVYITWVAKDPANPIQF